MKKISVKDVLNIKTSRDIDKFLVENVGFTLNERNITESDISDNWLFVGDNIYNNASIAILDDPNKGIIERLTNAVDSIIDKGFKDNFFKNGTTSSNVISKTFPKFHQRLRDVSLRNQKLHPLDAGNLIFLVLHDGSKTNKPTVDVLDLGTGISGDRFSKTILSLQKGNKSTTDSNHQIGSFGQGGSTTLGHSYSTIILSKQKGKYYFTIVKSVDIINLKSLSYVYLVNEGSVQEIYLSDNDMDNMDEHIKELFSSESGTLVRMIETEVDIQYRKNDITKKHGLLDYVNTEIFDSPLPIKVIDNRERMKENKSNQTRYAYGSKNKLKNSSHVIEEYSGSLNIIHKERPFEIDYYIILPTSKEDWAIDSKCKDVFKMFNIHETPLIYTMNGQYISSEGFTRFGNIDGLRFLQYRLLIDVNLDGLGTEKYRFVTSNRKSIQKTDLAEGFFTSVLDSIKNDKNINEINSLIVEMKIQNR